MSEKEWIESKFVQLNKSTFRSKFHLNEKDKLYVRERGMEAIREHADMFVRERLAIANNPRDGKQTPMRGHPVFIAQHATATCCRGCLEKWHTISKEGNLSEKQIHYIVDVIMTYIEKEMV